MYGWRGLTGNALCGGAFGAHNYRGLEAELGINQAELGINQVFLTAAARHDPVFRGFPPDLEVCEWHSNHFELPSGAIRLARSAMAKPGFVSTAELAAALGPERSPHAPLSHHATA